MEEDTEMQLEELKESMEKSLHHTQQEISKIRAGRASPDMLDGVLVEYYGFNTPLNQLASISTPDAKTLLIKPFEKGMIKEIEKAITNSDLGFNPQNDGENVIVNIPSLTEERRKELVKKTKNEAEQGKISIRNLRKDTNDELKKLQKEGVSEDEIKKAEEEVQKLTDKYVGKIDEMLAKKEEEIMKV